MLYLGLSIIALALVIDFFAIVLSLLPENDEDNKDIIFIGTTIGSIIGMIGWLVTGIAALEYL